MERQERADRAQRQDRMALAAATAAQSNVSAVAASHGVPQVVAPQVVVQPAVQPAKVVIGGTDPLLVESGWRGYEGEGGGEWGDRWSDCFADCPTCLFWSFCSPCASCQAADMLIADGQPEAMMFKCPGQFSNFCTAIGPYGIGICIGYFVCPTHTAGGCYTTSLVKMTMHKYGLKHPDPCPGSYIDSQPGRNYCLFNAWLCTPCLQCLVTRELKRRQAARAGTVQVVQAPATVVIQR